MNARYHLATPDAPGAVAIVQIVGPDASRAVEALAGAQPEARLKLANLADIDEGLIVALREDWCQVMPHGGTRVVHRLLERLQAIGIGPAEALSAREQYPEASTALEADMLAALAKAASPAAIDRLLAQPDAWRRALVDGRVGDATVRRQLLDRGEAMAALVEPATVVLVGRANVGKSTLTNLVMGRTASVVADLPGTTRDWVGGLAELPTPLGEVAVRWFDTPGLRASDDAIEQRAIALAGQVVASAAVLIAMTDHEADWPEAAGLPREPDVWVANKADLLRGGQAGPTAPGSGSTLRIAAGRGEGLEALGEAVSAALGLEAGAADEPWPFSPTLRACLAADDRAGLEAYAGL